MKKLLLALAIVIHPAAALAQGARPSSWTMTCGQARALVQTSGALVMNFSPTTYERVVSSVRFCLGLQVIVPEFAPTRDAPRCHVGYVCREIEYERE